MEAEPHEWVWSEQHDFWWCTMCEKRADKCPPGTRVTYRDENDDE